jgi:CBS domain-containing protein
LAIATARRLVTYAKDVMTPHVVSVGADESVFVAARPMSRMKSSGLPVVNDLGNLIGVVTESDLLRRAEIGLFVPSAAPS